MKAAFLLWQSLPQPCDQMSSLEESPGTGRDSFDPQATLGHLPSLGPQRMAPLTSVPHGVDDPSGVQ